MRTATARHPECTQIPSKQAREALLPPRPLPPLSLSLSLYQTDKSDVVREHTGSTTRLGYAATAFDTLQNIYTYTKGHAD